MGQPIMRPGDRNAQAAAHTGNAPNVIESLRALHLEAVDNEKFFGVMNMGAKRAGKIVSVAEIDSDDQRAQPLMSVSALIGRIRLSIGKGNTRAMPSWGMP